MQLVEQRDGRFDIVVVQANIIPVSAGDAGNSDLVAQMAMGTVNGYEITMSNAELVETLR